MEMQEESYAPWWPNYKDLPYSQNQPANAEISFCKGTKRRRGSRQKVLFSEREPVGDLRARNIPFPGKWRWVSKLMIRNERLPGFPLFL